MSYPQIITNSCFHTVQNTTYTGITNFYSAIDNTIFEVTQPMNTFINKGIVLGSGGAGGVAGGVAGGCGWLAWC